MGGKKGDRDASYHDSHELAHVFHQRDVFDKLNDLMVRNICVGSRVNVQGLIPVPGNAIIRRIDEETGNAIVAIASVDGSLDSSSSGKEEELATVDDPRRIALHYEDELEDEKSQLFLVAASVAEDLYESAMAQYHCFCHADSMYACRRLKAWRSSLVTPLTSNERLLVLGRGKGNLLSWSKSGLAVRFDDGTLEDHIPLQRVRRQDEAPFCGSATLNQLLMEDACKRPRPVLEYAREKMPYDSCRCPEKIDLVRLEKFVRDYAELCQSRMPYVEQMAKTLHRGEKDERYWEWFKKLKRSTEISEMASALYDHLRELPVDRNGCTVHIVEYRQKDTSSRGRLFAIGHHVYEDQCPRVISIQGMLPELRWRLLGSFAHYLDCDNSLVRILCSLATQMKLEHLIPTILDFRDKRGKWIKRIMKIHPSVTQEEAKRLPNVILSGGLYITWVKALEAGDMHEGLQEFCMVLYQEARVFADQLLIQPRFQWTDVERRKLSAEGRTEGAIKMALFNLIVQSCENEILSIIHRTLHKSGWVVRALVFDSVIAEPRRSKSPSVDEVIKLAMEACSEKGWDALVREKPLRGLHDEPMHIFDEATACLEEYLAHLERTNVSGSMSPSGGAELLSAAMDGAVRVSMKTNDSVYSVPSPQRHATRTVTRHEVLPGPPNFDNDIEESSASGFSSSESSDSLYSTDSPFTDGEEGDNEGFIDRSNARGPSGIESLVGISTRSGLDEENDEEDEVIADLARSLSESGDSLKVMRATSSQLNEHDEVNITNGYEKGTSSRGTEKISSQSNHESRQRHTRSHSIGSF